MLIAAFDQNPLAKRFPTFRVAAFAWPSSRCPRYSIFESLPVPSIPHADAITNGGARNLNAPGCCLDLGKGFNPVGLQRQSYRESLHHRARFKGIGQRTVTHLRKAEIMRLSGL